MIIITGANGQFGRAVAERLLERVPAERIGVSVRDPEKARDLEGRGVRVRRGDFDDAASLAHAFEGASRVLIVSVNSHGETAVRQHRAAIEAAKAAGGRRILYTSHMGANPASSFAPMVDHAATEAALQDAGVPFTALRNGFYADSAAYLLGAALQTGELAVPEDGPVAWTTPADLAEAAAVALTEESFDGVTPALTASEAVDMTSLAGCGHARGHLRRQPAGRLRPRRPDARPPPRPATDARAGRPEGGDPPSRVRPRRQWKGGRPGSLRVMMPAGDVGPSPSAPVPSLLVVCQANFEQ